MGSETSALSGVPAKPAPVFLHVYDLGRHSEVQTMNSVLNSLGTGAFHCGVEVYGQEFSFNYKPHGTGIFRCRPGNCPGHSYRTSVLMGEVKMTFDQVEELVSAMRPHWPGRSYHILDNNCCAFCDTFCRTIGVGPIPLWTRNLADAGSVVNKAYKAVAGVPLTVRAAVSAIGEEFAAFSCVSGCAAAKTC